MAGLFEGTITIGTNEYRELVRNEVVLEVVKNYLTHEKYVTKKDLKQMLGMPMEEGDE